MTLEELIEKLPQYILVEHYVFELELKRVSGEYWMAGYGNIYSVVLPTFENNIADAVSKLNAKVQQYQKGDLDACQPEHCIARKDIIFHIQTT